MCVLMKGDKDAKKAEIAVVLSGGAEDFDFCFVTI